MFPEGRIFELLIVFAVALIVVGPKDLPVMMRRVGRFVAHMRGMAAEFRASFDEMARQSELDELRKEVEAMKSGRTLPALAGLEADPHTQGIFDDIHASLRSDGASTAMTAPPQPVAEPVVEAPPASALATEAADTDSSAVLHPSAPLAAEPAPSQAAS